MTLEEAIRKLEADDPLLMESWSEDLKEAVRLGLEALKWRREAEEKKWLGYLAPLPGETEE